MPKEKKLEEVCDCGECELAPMPVFAPSADSRTLYIIGEVTNQTLAMFAPFFFELEKEKGEILIKLSSPGGEVSAGTAIYDIIKSAKNEVVIHGYGMVSSVATLILQAADTRLLSENCGLMVHQVSTYPGEGPSKAQDLLIHSQEVERLNELYYNIMSKRSGLSKTKIRELCSQDTYITSKKAVELGLADGIIK